MSLIDPSPLVTRWPSELMYGVIQELVVTMTK